LNPPGKTTAAVGFGLRFLLRLLGWSISAAVALVVLLYVAMPALLRFGIPHALSRYGIASSIESARVDIADEKITLVGFNVGPGKGAGVRWGEVVALVDMKALMKGNIRILDIQVKDARVDLRQLAAAGWEPSIAETDTGGKPLQLDVGEAVIRDLRFVGLSERLGRPVSVTSLKVGGLSRLNRGEPAAFGLEAKLGEAKLKLAGTAKLQDGLPVMAGRYEFGTFSLDGIPAAPDTPGRTFVKGRTSGAGTFTLRYQPEGAVVKLKAAGRLAVHDLVLQGAPVALTEAGIDWDGGLEMDWPLGGEPPTFRANGRAAARHIVAGAELGGNALQFESEGLRWDGEIRFRKFLSLAGRMEADTVRAGGGATRAKWRLVSDGVVLDALRHTGDEGFHIQAVNAGETRVFLSRDDAGDAATLSSVSISNLRSSRDGYTIDSVSLDSAESLPSQTAPAGRWKLAGLSSSDIGVSNDGRLTIALLSLGQGQLDHSAMHVSVTDAKAGGIEGSANAAAWKVAAVSVASLRHRRDATEIWGHGLALAGGQFGENDRIAADSLRADRVRQLSSDALDWEIASVEASGVSGTADALQADKATASSFTHRLAGSGELAIDGAEVSEAAYRKNIDVRASRLQFKRLLYNSGNVESLQVTGSTASAPAYGEDGIFSAKGVDAKHLVYTDGEAETTRFEVISASGVEGDVKSGIRVETAAVDRWHHEGTAGVDTGGENLEVRALNAAFQGAVVADRAILDSLAINFSDGVNVSLAGLTVQGPGLPGAGGLLVADGARARELGVQHGANRRLSVRDVEAGRLTPGPSGGHALSFLRAIRAEATDDVIGTQLESGRLSLEGLGASEQGHVTIGRGVFENLSLADTRGTPAAFFSAREITLDDGGVVPGKLLDLGRIRIDDVHAVAGFSEFSRFVLPRAPFSGGNEESTVELAVTRLETRGDGRLSFFDRSTLPPFELGLAPFSASLENYHSGDTAAPASFGVKGKIGEYTSLKASGSVAQNQDGVDLKLEGKVTAFDLERLNTYVTRHTESALRAGRGDATFDIKISGQKLTGDTRFVFSKVQFEPAADATPAGAGQDLSLESAFAMLKDKDDVVRVSVPLSGSLDDPQFDFSDAVTQSVVKAVQNTVMLTFKPLGLLVSVADLVGVGPGLRFNPVSFDAGEAALTGQALGYLDTLARELEKHPKVALKICGRAVPADLIALEKAGAVDALSGAGQPPAEQKNLAALRAIAVRRYLERDKGIDPARLPDCPASVESIPGSLPRAEMLVHVESWSRPAAARPGAGGTAD
jgi:hypothetical protein